MLSRIACFSCAALLLAGGIGGSLSQAERSETHALAGNGGTRLQQMVVARLGEQRAQTGAWPLEDGADAFGARVGLARAASRTLDVQYYIFHADDTGHAFLGELLAAADRGVRVRLLLDDIHTARLEPMLAAAAAHPNLEVRLFNPFVHRRAAGLDHARGRPRSALRQRAGGGRAAKGVPRRAAAAAHRGSTMNAIGRQHENTDQLSQS